MYWQESKEKEHYIVPDDIVDVVFGIHCRSLPVDHAYALSLAITQALPWFADEETAGLHTIHVADSGNGWMRPDQADALLHLSRRTKLVLRLPKHRVDNAGSLTGLTLGVAGHPLRVDKAAVKSLSKITTLLSRYIVVRDGVDEDGFLQDALAQLSRMGIQPRKMLCGMEHVIATPDRAIRVRSLMITELTVEESVKLQQRGLGAGRKLGCGLFIPHKDIREVRQVLD